MPKSQDDLRQPEEKPDSPPPSGKAMMNPYTFGIPVQRKDRFFGREEELALIKNTLGNVPRGEKQDIAVLGPRRIGKSSLLYRLQQLLASSSHFVPVYLDVQHIEPQKSSALFFEILEDCREGFAQKTPPVMLPEFGTLASSDIPEDLRFYVFKKDMERLNRFIAAHDLPRLVLMLDEAELLQVFGGPDTLGWFRGLIQSMTYIIFVVAGSERLYSLTQDYGSPFYNIFKPVELRQLSDTAAKKLVQVPAARIGMVITDAETEKILRYAGNSPYLIQGICHYLVELLNRRERRRVCPEDVDEVIIHSVEHFSGQFSYVWGGVSQVQRIILYTLAKRGRPQDSHYLVSAVPRVRKLLKSEAERQDVFDDLIRLQVLEVTDSNRYWFVATLFADWILERVDDKEIIQLTRGIVRPLTATQLPSEASPISAGPAGQPNSILIITVMRAEAQAVLDVFSQSAGKAWTREVIGNKTYYNLGVHGGAPVYMVQPEVDTATPGGALLTVRRALQDLQPQAAIVCGIAFGLHPDRQQLGDILVAKQLLYYEPQKVDLRKGEMPRGDRTIASERLLDRFRSGDNDWQGAQTHFGLFLSVEKLVDDLAFRDRLLKTAPEAIGGEMEGAGLYIAARDAKVDWILVKAICDLANARGDDAAKVVAARNAAQFVSHVLQLGGWGMSEQLRPLTFKSFRTLRTILSTEFDDQQLEAFALDHLPEVYDRYSRGMRKDEKVNLMLDYVRRDPNAYTRLIHYLEEDYPLLVKYSGL